MISIQDFSTGMPIFRALNSEVRAQILSLIAGNDGISMKEISKTLDIPVTTLTPHLRILCDCQLVLTPPITPPHEALKYYFNQDAAQLSISIAPDEKVSALYRAEVPLGHYTDFSVTPTCGIASAQSFIGQVDEPRYFVHPEHYNAQILWFTTGYVSYMLPNFIPRGSIIERLTISFEISSEAPSYNNDWPSDITFFLNKVNLGTWKSPGDYGDRRGKLNPDWWYSFLNQYGLLKKLSICSDGTYLDEERLSDVTIGKLHLTDQSILRFCIAVMPGENARGCTLYGHSFGDHNQAIQIEIQYRPV